MTTFLVLFFQCLAWSAPHPLASSSIINKVQTNLAFSQMGFKIGSIPADWIYKPGIDDSNVSIEVGPNNLKSKAALSFHVENLTKKTSLEQYVRQYLRDYNQYGFEVVNLESIKRSAAPSVIVDLNQKNKQTRSRQVFFMQDQKIIVASCLDNSETFDKTVYTCNQILSSFQWNPVIK